MILRPGTTDELRHLARRVGDALTGGNLALSMEDYLLLNQVIEALEADAEVTKGAPE